MAVKRLKVAVHNARAVAMIGGTLRIILRFAKWRSSEGRHAVQPIGMHGAQYIGFVHYPRKSIDLELRYKCYGNCAASGFLFLAWSGGLSKVSLEF